MCLVGDEGGWGGVINNQVPKRRKRREEEGEERERERRKRKEGKGKRRERTREKKKKNKEEEQRGLLTARFLTTMERGLLSMGQSSVLPE